jgi:hypothetical protein
MLRYDRCYPATPEAVERLVVNRRDFPEEYHTPRTVELASIGETKAQVTATKDRWRSFGWVVLEGSTRVCRA